MTFKIFLHNTCLTQVSIRCNLAICRFFSFFLCVVFSFECLAWLIEAWKEKMFYLHNLIHSTGCSQQQGCQYSCLFWRCLAIWHTVLPSWCVHWKKSIWFVICLGFLVVLVSLLLTWLYPLKTLEDQRSVYTQWCKSFFITKLQVSLHWYCIHREGSCIILYYVPVGKDLQADTNKVANRDKSGSTD